MLLRTVSIAASIRTGDSELATAEERIAEAIEQLERIDSVKRAAGTIQKSATKIESDCTSITTTIHRLLDQAILALAGTASTDGRRQTPAGFSGAA